jgi:hypothetical protein
LSWTWSHDASLGKKGTAIGNECRSPFQADVKDTKLAAEAEKIVGENAPASRPLSSFADEAAQIQANAAASRGLTPNATSAAMRKVEVDLSRLSRPIIQALC